MQSIRLSSSLTEIPAHCFESCRSLESVVIPGSVQTIGEGAFGGCQNLDAIALRSGLTTIGSSAFWGTTITRLTIPDSVSEIQTGAFAGTRRLPELTVSPGNPHFQSLDGIIYSRDLTALDLPTFVNRIGEFAFRRCYALTEINVPAHVAHLEKQSFSHLRSLEVISFEGDRPTLGDGVFSDSSPNFTVVIQSTATGFQSTFQGRPLTVAVVPDRPAPVITGLTFTPSTVRISVEIASSPRFLIALYSSSDFKTWTRVVNMTFADGVFIISRDANSAFYRVHQIQN